MQTFDSLETFWENHRKMPVNKFGFDDWTIVRFAHINDVSYAQKQAADRDELGFQPLSITLANPFSHQATQVVVKNVNDRSLNDFYAFYTKHFMEQLNKRFGSFRPEKFDAFTEYDSWENFKKSWIERDGKLVIAHNLPLLFDHMPKVEYWSRRQTGQKVLPYQRLLVTTYFVSQNKFFDFIIKDVSDEAMDHIALLLKSRIGIHADSLFMPPR